VGLAVHQKPLAAPPKVMGALPADAVQRARCAANGNLNSGGGGNLQQRTASPQQPSPPPRRVTAGPLPSGGGGAIATHTSLPVLPDPLAHTGRRT
jgi:hypothetical protein